MTEITPYGTDEWIARISEQELPALCSTIREIEQLSKDDISSLATLSQSVLHDHALTSAILKVANSPAYMGRNPVTTVSRASVVLGLTAIKNICLTAKLLNSLLKNKKLSPGVYERLLRLMAQSFHAGMLARMVMQDYGDDIQEEAFIAALLNRFGESAFWSCGGQLVNDLDKELRRNRAVSASQKSRVIQQKLGTSFEQMSLGLARSWNMGQVVISALEEPELRTPEMRSVNLAVELSELLASPKRDYAAEDRIYGEIAELMKLDQKEIWAAVETCNEQTIELMQSYGAGVLTRFISQDVTQQGTGEQGTGEAALPGHEPGSKELQLKVLRELAFLPSEGGDFNLVVQTALEGIHRGMNMSRTLVFLKSRDRKTLIPRFISAADVEDIKRKFRVPLDDEPNIFSHTLNTGEPLWVSDIREMKWHSLMTAPVRRVVDRRGFLLAPIMWGNYCVGLFYTDRQLKRGEAALPELSQEDYLSFTLFAQQTNLCLSMVIKK